MPESRTMWTPETVPDSFWSLVDQARGDVRRYRQLVADLPPPQLREMYWQYHDLAEWLLTERHLAFVEDPSDDQIMDLSNWIVSRGRQVYFDIREHPEKTPPTIPFRSRGQSFLSVIIVEYHRRTGRDIV